MLAPPSDAYASNYSAEDGRSYGFSGEFALSFDASGAGAGELNPYLAYTALGAIAMISAGSVVLLIPTLGAISSQ